MSYDNMTRRHVLAGLVTSIGVVAVGGLVLSAKEPAGGKPPKPTTTTTTEAALSGGHYSSYLEGY